MSKVLRNNRLNFKDISIGILLDCKRNSSCVTGFRKVGDQGFFVIG
jgi:hypothetical protein